MERRAHRLRLAQTGQNHSFFGHVLWAPPATGSSDDTTAIQNAINAANANGGGIVLLTPGKFKITGTLDVKSGVELRGPYEMAPRLARRG